jgi:hypothetical protein
MEISKCQETKTSEKRLYVFVLCFGMPEINIFFAVFSSLCLKKEALGPWESLYSSY